MLFAAIWLFTFSTLDVAFGFRHNILAFIVIKGDPIAYFSNTSNWLNVMKMAADVAQAFMADSILVSAALQLLAKTQSCAVV